MTCEHPTLKASTAYVYGCRCDRCMTWHRAYHREYKRTHPQPRRPRQPLPPIITVRRPMLKPSGYIYWCGYHGHPLAKANGDIAAHRWIMWWKCMGLQPARCEYCARPFDGWHDIDVHHVNGDKADNRPDNLAATCHRCNTRHTLVYRNQCGEFPNPRAANMGAVSLVGLASRSPHIVSCVFTPDPGPFVAQIDAQAPIGGT